MTMHRRRCLMRRYAVLRTTVKNLRSWSNTHRTDGAPAAWSMHQMPNTRTGIRKKLRPAPSGWLPVRKLTERAVTHKTQTNHLTGNQRLGAGDGGLYRGRILEDIQYRAVSVDGLAQFVVAFI